MSGSPVLLLAEDEPLVADLIETSLQDAGYEVISVKTGVDAIAALEAQPEKFSGVITDIRMAGGKDGWDVGHRARELIVDIPVIYMSGDSGAEWTSKGVPHSVLITKPFAIAQVATAISSLLTTA